MVPESNSIHRYVSANKEKVKSNHYKINLFQNNNFGFSADSYADDS